MACQELECVSGLCTDGRFVNNLGEADRGSLEVVHTWTGQYHGKGTCAKKQWSWRPKGQKKQDNSFYGAAHTSLSCVLFFV